MLSVPDPSPKPLYQPPVGVKLPPHDVSLNKYCQKFIIQDEKQACEIDALMPNGTIGTVNVAAGATFAEIKEELFEVARKAPMFGMLKDRKSYGLHYIDACEPLERELYDENVRYLDINPFGGILKLVEINPDGEQVLLDESIGRLIGKPMSDFDALRNPEVNEFRHRMQTMCDTIVKQRQLNSWDEKMSYAFPTFVSDVREPPKYLRKRIAENGKINVTVTFSTAMVSLELSIHYSTLPSELLTHTLSALSRERKYHDVYETLVEQCKRRSGALSESHYEPIGPPKKSSVVASAVGKLEGQIELRKQFAKTYVLRMNGCLEYLLGEKTIIQYRIIQQKILDDRAIKLVAIPKTEIVFEDEPIYSVPDLSPKPRDRSQSIISLSTLSTVIGSTKRRSQTFHSWGIDRKLVIKIHSAQRFNFLPDVSRVAIMLCIFHGGESLCDTFMTSVQALPPSTQFETTQPQQQQQQQQQPNNNNNNQVESVAWDEDIIFNLKVSDLPRMARLCVVMVGFTGAGKANVKTNPGKPLAWANINFYDYHGILRECSTTLSMWPYLEDDIYSEDTKLVFCPLRTVVPNPALDQATKLTISFAKYTDGQNSVIKYPDMRDIERKYSTGSKAGEAGLEIMANAQIEEESSEADEIYETAFDASDGGGGGSNVNNANSGNSLVASEDENTPKKTIAGKIFLEQIKEICDRDLLHKISQNEQELLWRLRKECRTVMPTSLSKLLSSIRWNNQKTIGETLYLLQSWPKLEPYAALELLDYAYADSKVRKFAIECLRDMNVEILLQFLLQLVQAVKYESYIYNDLVQFLLERAYENQRVGHSLFWLLRSEMHEPAVSVTFGLILEAYCRGAPDHIPILTRQIEFIQRLKRINEIIRDDRSRDSREKKIVLMQDMLKQKYYQEAFHNVVNPLDPSYKLGPIIVNKCKFMDSKMKPLWLVFQNEDKNAQPIYLIFKNGDDLRQDMLTVQMIDIMDKLWKAEGLDLRVTPYQCIALEHNVGLIEVVLNADTIANIQKEKGAAAIAAFKRGSLFNWLKEHNPTKEALDRAVQEFTLSCAGYCVATYILGIADRHSDNIMIKKNGQLFHIDFGHILGKFKEKFGIRRERVPFVLTNDFEYVITHAGECKQNFKIFQNYCEEAFLIIRRKGQFIISVFAMMLSTGIPEISSVDDLNYLRETLVLDMSEEQARKNFVSKFTEALRNSWKTSLNWMAHSIAKHNKMTE